MQLKDVGASLRRHWPTALVILVLIPIVAGVYLHGRKVVRPPARYTNSADVLIPSPQTAANNTNNTNNANDNTAVPPVLLQGQTALALSQKTQSVALAAARVDATKTAGITFGATLNTNGDIMTLSVSAPRPELASSLLDQYVIAFQEGRRQSVLDATIHRQTTESLLVSRLSRKLTDINATP